METSYSGHVKLALCALLLASFSCETQSGSSVSDAGTSADSGDAAPAVSAWQYVATPGAFCANGSETGFGISPAQGSDTAVVFLTGGGACWEAGACYLIKSATHFEDTVQGPTVLAEVASSELAPVFDRSRSDNPFAGANLVYVPYCTGDLHAGTRVNSYDFLGTRKAHHVGGLNIEAYLAKLKPLLPRIKRVVLVGVSAGGYGATLNWWRVRRAFGPSVRVDVLDDSGPPIDVANDGRWGSMKSAWAIETPSDCAGCADGLSKWLPYYNTHVGPQERYGLLATTGDDVIGLFFGLDDPTQSQRLLALRAAAGPRQKTFIQTGNAHVLMTQRPWPMVGGVPLGLWIQQFLSDSPIWDHKGP